MCCFLNFMSDDTGQDLIEYALLTAVIGLAGAAWWGSVTNGIGTAYQGWDNGMQALWVPPDP